MPSSGWAENAGGKKKTNKPRDTDAKKNKKQEKEEEKKGKKRKDKEPEAEEVHSRQLIFSISRSVSIICMCTFIRSFVMFVPAESLEVLAVALCVHAPV